MEYKVWKILSFSTCSLLWTSTVLDILCNLFNLNMFSSLLNAFLHLLCPLTSTYPSRQMSKCIYYINQIKSLPYYIYHSILLYLWTSNLCSMYLLSLSTLNLNYSPNEVKVLENIFLDFYFYFSCKCITQCLAYYMRYIHKGIADVHKLKDGK